MYQFVPGIRKRSLFFYFRRSGIRFTLDAFRFVLAPLPQPLPGGEPCILYFRTKYRTATHVYSPHHTSFSLVFEKISNITPCSHIASWIVYLAGSYNGKTTTTTEQYAELRIHVLHEYLSKSITRFPSGKRLGEWRKNETKSIQRETNTTTPEIENKDRFRIPGTCLLYTSPSPRD